MKRSRSDGFCCVEHREQSVMMNARGVRRFQHRRASGGMRFQNKLLSLQLPSQQEPGRKCSWAGRGLENSR